MLYPGLAEIRMRDAPDSVLALFHPEVGQVRDRIPVLRRLHLAFFREGFKAPPLPRPLPDFDQVLAIRPPLARFAAGQTVRQSIDATNPSGHRWSALGRGANTFDRAVRLSYHWLSAAGETVVLDGLRTELPHDLLPGEHVEVRVAIRAPEEPGRFVLRLTMVQEGIAWFDERGARTLDLPVDVVAPP
jgi:hypothetical protein